VLYRLVVIGLVVTWLAVTWLVVTWLVVTWLAHLMVSLQHPKVVSDLLTGRWAGLFIKGLAETGRRLR
jgi:hypothetical protein